MEKSTSHTWMWMFKPHPMTITQQRDCVETGMGKRWMLSGAGMATFTLRPRWPTSLRVGSMFFFTTNSKKLRFLAIFHLLCFFIFGLSDNLITGLLNYFWHRLPSGTSMFYQLPKYEQHLAPKFEYCSCNQGPVECTKAGNGALNPSKVSKCSVFLFLHV